MRLPNCWRGVCRIHVLILGSAYKQSGILRRNDCFGSNVDNIVICWLGCLSTQWLDKCGSVSVPDPNSLECVYDTTSNGDTSDCTAVVTFQLNDRNSCYTESSINGK
jgi:hypothetical protein